MQNKSQMGLCLVNSALIGGCCMKMYRRLMVVLLGFCLSLGFSMVGMAMDEVPTKETEVVMDNGLLNEQSDTGTPRYTINLITKVSVAPGYYDEAKQGYYYYSSKMVSKSYNDNNAYMTYPKSLRMGTGITHIRVQVTFTHANSSTVTPSLDGVRQPALNYNEGTCTYTTYFPTLLGTTTNEISLYCSGVYNELFTRVTAE